jgi:hypothetical protein
MAPGGRGARRARGPAGGAVVCSGKDATAGSGLEDLPMEPGDGHLDGAVGLQTQRPGHPEVTSMPTMAPAGSVRF